MTVTNTEASQSIDYSALDRHLGWSGLVRKVGSVSFLLVIVSLAILATTISIGSILLKNTVGIISVFLPELLGVAVCLVVIRARDPELNWKMFAESNGWNVEHSEDLRYVPSSLRGMGVVGPTSTVIVAKVGSSTQRILTCYSNLSYLIICIELAVDFPHIILNGIRNNSGAEFLFENSKRVSLEGDFDKYFRLYIDKQEAIDALSIITPDIMSQMITHSARHDIEISGKKLFFISDMPKVTSKSLRVDLESAQPIIGEILHRAKSLNYVPKRTDEVRESFLSKSGIVMPRVIFGVTRDVKILTAVALLPIILGAIGMWIFSRNFHP